MASRLATLAQFPTSSARRAPFLAIPLQSRAQSRSGTSSSKTSTPYRFRFLLHTEEFQEQLNKRTTDEALREKVLDELATLNNNKDVTPTLTSTFSDLRLDPHEVQVLRYDLADAFGFFVPVDERLSKFECGEDVVEWIKGHTQVLKEKAAGTVKYVPRNLTGGL
ncbi:hypothetical protein HDU93_009120 [Gonapodya sp. JEL0774]|nr:hypothetical protein HDU93_009120 [Gonapodya sp. JEL0774]